MLPHSQPWLPQTVAAGPPIQDKKVRNPVPPFLAHSDVPQGSSAPLIIPAFASTQVEAWLVDIGNVVQEDAFVKWNSEFVDKNCDKFDEQEEENKLEYTSLFEGVSLSRSLSLPPSLLLSLPPLSPPSQMNNLFLLSRLCTHRVHRGR
jgi:hypothetical protein